MKTKPIQKTVLFSFLMAIVITCGKSDIDTPEAPIEDEVILDPPVVTPSPYVNLNSSISFSATETVNEGDYVQFTIELGTQLSEALPINLAFNSDSLVNVLNPEDYSTVLGYSLDNATTWSQAQNNTINIPKETSTLFIRFDTHDDNKLEVHEAVYVQLEAQPQNDVVLSNTASSTFKITVLDNEDNGHDFFGGFMTFTVDDAYKLSLNSVARTVSTTQEKAFID